ncbi:hypothetical protein KAH27_06695 [bacterium]|nr:hypothetical protein [bacterium]
MNIFLVSLLIFSLFVSCSKKKDEKINSIQSKAEKVEQEADSQLPEGYPAELILPKGISASDIKTGKGRIPTPGGKNDKIFNVYVIDKKNLKNYLEIINHFKELLTKDNNWDGEWKGENTTEAYGSFKKNNVHLKIEINAHYFSLKIDVFDNLIS